MKKKLTKVWISRSRGALKEQYDYCWVHFDDEKPTIGDKHFVSKDEAGPICADKFTETLNLKRPLKPGQIRRIIITVEATR